MKDGIKIQWRVDDGSVRGSRFSTELDVDDFADCSDEQIHGIICERITEDFEQKVSWTADIDETVALIKAKISEGDSQ